ncbi:polysaccharide deacetylase family protein [Roseobacter sp. EG26]|uniref:polysaccharide deacetylase family protein n=1 Tax=Roseobacter sp. EG26 TaxID=3412477 RepID=UPI003CE517C2
MKVDWSPLRRELARLRAADVALPIWWRDDDAVRATPEFEQLCRLSEELRMPVHLAVIPGLAEPTLAAAIAPLPHVLPVAHGWRHQNQAPEGEKKAEFGHFRVDASFDLERGFSQMRQLFGKRFIPAFVAPWNRLSDAYHKPLADVGYKVVSTFSPRETVSSAHSLITINTHVDPIAWRGTRGLVDPEILIARTCQNLSDRTEGKSDATEPMGYLTHHLVHIPEIWAFSRMFLSELLSGGGYEKSLSTSIEEIP